MERIGRIVNKPRSRFIYLFSSRNYVTMGNQVTCYKENKGLLLLSTYVIVVSWLDVGTLSFGYEPFAWWGLGWGPRYLIPVLPFITIVLGNLLTHLRKKIFMKSQ